jgi:CDP-diglyceride synthetase|tara:strand:- start:255 stop:629 length:375 start_codon:yes stop_codon:yes gene_type:complete
MSASLKYAAAGVCAIALIVAGLWPFLDVAARNGVLVAAVTALPIQVAAFAVLIRYRGELNGFLSAWVGGMMVRMLVVAVVAVTAVRTDAEGAVPMLLALVGFFFGLLLLEPVYLRGRSNQTAEA